MGKYQSNVAPSVAAVLPGMRNGERGDPVDEKVDQGTGVQQYRFLCSGTFTQLACPELLTGLTEAVAFQIKRLVK